MEPRRPDNATLDIRKHPSLLSARLQRFRMKRFSLARLEIFSSFLILPGNHGMETVFQTTCYGSPNRVQDQDIAQHTKPATGQVQPERAYSTEL